MQSISISWKIEESKHKQNYGFHTRNCPAVLEERTEFEWNLQLMIENSYLKKLIIPCTVAICNKCRIL